MTRYYINGGPKAQAAAEEALDRYGVDCDWDGGGRLMVPDGDASEAAEALDEAGINYDEI